MATDVNEEHMHIDPERERIWNEDSDPTFTEIRANAAQDEIDETLEQPSTTSVTEDSNGVEDNADTSTDVDTADKDIPDDQPKPVEVENKDVEDNGVFKIKANGVDIDLTIDELKALAPKAMDYTKKMQEIAPWRKTISALKEQGLGESDVNLMIDVLKGDKQAIAEVLNRTKVDPLELDTDSKNAYQPTQYGKDETVLRIEEIINTISADPEYKITEQVVDTQWDSRSRAIMAQNPDMIMGLHVDIKDGTYDKVAPLAFKLKVMDDGRLADVDYYIEAGRRLNDEATQEEGTNIQHQKQSQAQAEIKQKDAARKAATPTKRMSGQRDVIDYLNDSDEDFDEWYKKTMASR